MADSNSIRMNLTNDLRVNGKVYKAGQNVEVPRKQAEDLARMDHDHNQYLANLNKKRTMEVDSGTISVGGGAQ